MTNFNQVRERNLKQLQMYVPVVARVHGESHPEFYTVQKLFNELNSELEKVAVGKPKLSSIFAELQAVTSGYAIPADVCESYEAVYKMLQELDEAYQK